jgi:hypothetical protein
MALSDVTVYSIMLESTCDVCGGSLVSYMHNLHIASFIYAGLIMYGCFHMISRLSTVVTTILHFKLLYEGNVF